MCKHPQSSGGYRALCLECNRIRVRYWRSKNNQKHRLQANRYYQKNPHKYTEHAAKRRVRVRNRFVSWADDFLISEVYHLSQLRTKLTNVNWEVDHIIPLSGETVSGLHVPENLRVITQFENRSKGNGY